MFATVTSSSSSRFPGFAGARSLLRSSVLFTSVLLFSSVAVASPIYPSTIRDHLGMTCTPRCTVCHESEPGRSGNAQQPFAESLVALGAKAQDRDLLITKLDELEVAGTDSDEDGVPDIAELRGSSAPGAAGATGTGEPGDPSAVGGGDVCANLPNYGCGAQLAPSRWADSLPLFGALALGFALFLVRSSRTASR